MSQVEPKSYDRQPVPDLEDLVSLKAYQTLRDALQGFEGVVMEHFFDLTPDDRTAFVEGALDGLCQFRDSFALDCGNQCPKGRACVPCASAPPTQ
jgi:hypothetical protein